MVTPNMPSSAQDIINNFLSGGYSTQAQANPYRVDVDPFRPPINTPEEDDKLPNDPCPEGFVYDPVMKRCMPIEETKSDDDDKDAFDPTKSLLDRMKKDPTTGFGASSILDDYITQGLGEGTFIKFDPNIGRLGAGSINPFLSIGGGLLDSLTGGANRRENLYNDALQYMMDNQYGKKIGSDLFRFFTPKEYYNQVRRDMVDPENKMQETTNLTVGNAVEQLMRNEPSEGGGSPIAEDLSGGLLYTSPLTSVDSSGNRTRNDDAYRAALARNVKANPTKFRSNIGGTGRAGFLGGR
tara:strand:+ start:66 stop:953 length:888 start_codon:yes stop_codon:yes gene_type:complete